jgi:hypothetical protein
LPHGTGPHVPARVSSDPDFELPGTFIPGGERMRSGGNRDHHCRVRIGAEGPERPYCRRPIEPKCPRKTAPFVLHLLCVGDAEGGTSAQLFERIANTINSFVNLTGHQSSQLQGFCSEEYRSRRVPHSFRLINREPVIDECGRVRAESIQTCVARM